MKLVRDKIPNIIRESGNKFETKTTESAWEHLAWLKIKIDEESQEFLQDPCVEEAADIYEVFLSIIHLTGHKLEDVINVADRKRSERGSFKKGILLK